MSPLPADPALADPTAAADAPDLAELRRQLAAAHATAQLSEHNPNPLLRFSADGQLTFANAAARALHRHLALPEVEQLHERLRQALRVPAHQAHFELEGRVFQLSAVPHAPPAGSTLLYLTDITARVTAERRLAEQQTFTTQILASIPSLVYVRDAGGRVVFENQAMLELRAHLTALSGTLAGAALPLSPAEMARYGQADAQVLASGQQLATDDLLTLPDGTVRHYQTVKRLLVRPDGTRQVLGVSTDITAQHQAKLAAETAALARENFLANMSHEMRTPLNGVLGMAAQLAKTALDPRQHEFVGTIRHAGQHLLRVINDVLDMAKITSGKLEMEARAFNLCDAMAEALRPLAEQAREKGLHFAGTRLRDTCPHPWVLGDAHRLNQILINLVANAVKFTPAGGRVTVVGEQLSETAATLTVRFRVEDTGIGIAADKQEAIFEGFTQAYADTARQFGGTGLGLSISRALVRQLGGELTLQSQPGQGSTFAFTLTLPKAPATAPPALAPPDAYDTGVLRGRRVLVVEDNEINRTVARLLLEGWGAHVDEAEDGHRGVAQVQAEAPYDLVLMDIQLPGLNGLEATAAIRALPDPARAGTCVVALTANAFRSDCDRYLAAGLAACLAKPLDEEHVYRTLAGLLPPARPYDLTRLRTLARGREAFVQKIIRSFLHHMPESLARLEVAAAAADWPEAARLVHHVRPSLESLGVLGVAPLLAHFAAATPPAAPPPPDAVPRLVAQVRQVLAALPAELLAGQ